MVLLPLLTKCGVKCHSPTAPPPGGNAFAMPALFLQASTRSRALNSLVRLFVERNFPLWKDSEVVSWLKRVAVSVAERSDSREPSVAEKMTRAARILGDEYPAGGDDPFCDLSLSDYCDQAETTIRLEEEEQRQMDPPRHEHVNREIVPDNPLLAFLTTMLPWNRVRAGAPQAQGQGDGGDANDNGDDDDEDWGEEVAPQ